MLFFNRDDLIIIYDKINFGKINKNMNIDVKNKKIYDLLSRFSINEN